jgi:3-phenylpropionate/trans-cinnamate dioxygenase ferredoxin subunit
MTTVHAEGGGQAVPESGNVLVVGRVEDMPPGSVTVVDDGRYGIGVYNLDGQFHALQNYCPHRGAPVCRGALCGIVAPSSRGHYEGELIREGEFLRCPWHGWEFEIESGRSPAAPRKTIRKFPVTVQNGQVTLEGVKISAKQ